MTIQHHFGLKHLPLAKNCPSLWKDQAFIQLKQHFNQLLHTPGIGVLTAESGVGKTSALRHLTQELNPHQYHVFYVAETHFSSFDFYRQVAFALQLVPAYRYAQLWRDIKNHLRERVEHKRCFPIFIIDEAQNLSSDFFVSFPSFLNFDFDSRDIMTVWFLGHPNLNPLIDRAHHAAFASRIQVRYQLEPLLAQDRFTALIHHAFKEAGSQATLLSESGIELLRVASQGKPRLAHHVIVGAMSLAAEKGLNHLPDDLIREAIKQLK